MPVIVVSARTHERDKVEALELQQKNTKIAMEQMQAQIAALQAKLNGEDAR